MLRKTRSVKLNSASLGHLSVIKKAMCTSENCDNTLLKQMFIESVKAVQPHELIRNQIRYRQRHLEINGRKFVLTKPCHIVGFGKAVAGMAIEIEKILDNDLERAIVSVPDGIFKNLKFDVAKNSKIDFIQGAKNNLPDENAMKAAKKIHDLVKRLNEDDFLIVLVSGGGSALLPLPIPPVTLTEKQNLIKMLSQSGADIKDLNTVRIHLSLLKGGKLSQLAYPAKVVTLILSDVVGDPLDIIASGPTVSNETTPNDAIEIFKKYNVYNKIPESMKAVLGTTCDKQETVPNLDRVTNIIIGNNKIATGAAKAMAQKMGYQCLIMSHEIEGDVDEVSQNYADFVKILSLAIEQKLTKEQIRDQLKNLSWKVDENASEAVTKLDFSKKMIFIFAGEPTVVVKGKGKGGRNQQLALSFSLWLNNLEISPCNISFLSAGTDGIDGPTDAAGALGCVAFIRECEKQNLDARNFLENNDSYGVYSKVKNGKFLVKIGHSGTNVMDVHFLKIDPVNKQ